MAKECRGLVLVFWDSDLCGGFHGVSLFVGFIVGWGMVERSGEGVC